MKVQDDIMNYKKINKNMRCIEMSADRCDGIVDKR